MYRLIKCFVILVITQLILLYSGVPSSATAVIEGGEDNSSAFQLWSVQVIEGTQITNYPPIPPVDNTASEIYLQRNSLKDSFSWTSPQAEESHQRIASMVSRFNRTLNPYQAYQMSRAIHMLSKNYNIDPRILASVIAVESSFRFDAVSPSGAIGLGQLKPDTARWLGVIDPFDPVQNMWGVAKYLRYLLNRYNGSVQHALGAYFRGQGTVDRNGLDEGAISYIGKVNNVFIRFF